MSISIVIPVHNEFENILDLNREICEVLPDASEILWVNDGSDDLTHTLSNQMSSPSQMLSHPKRLGQSQALLSGIRASRGETILTLDGDGQCDPKEIPKLLSQLKRNDFVFGKRENRQDPPLKKHTSKIANGIRRKILRDPFFDLGSPFRAFRRSSLRGVPYFDGFHRFLPYLVWKNGFRVLEISISHRKRIHGKSHYGVMNRLFKTSLDLYRVSQLPLPMISLSEVGSSTPHS